MGDSGARRPKVLIIDEEGGFTKALAVYLGEVGLEAITASHWTDALDRVMQEPPHAILINPALSTVKGESILGYLREAGRQVPAVVVSDPLDPGRVEILKSLGADVFLQKRDGFYQIALALSRVLPGWSPRDAPIISDEEFERIVIQRLEEVASESESRASDRSRLLPPPLPVSGGLSSLSPDLTEDSDGPALPPPPPFRSGPATTLPPPPPRSEERHDDRRRSTRKRHRGGQSGFKRLFLTLFLICLVTGAVFLFLSKEIATFVKGGEKPAEQRK